MNIFRSFGINAGISRQGHFRRFLHTKVLGTESKAVVGSKPNIVTRFYNEPITYFFGFVTVFEFIGIGSFIWFWYGFQHDSTLLNSVYDSLHTMTSQHTRDASRKTIGFLLESGVLDGDLDKGTQASVLGKALSPLRLLVSLLLTEPLVKYVFRPLKLWIAQFMKKSSPLDKSVSFKKLPKKKL